MIGWKWHVSVLGLVGPLLALHGATADELGAIPAGGFRSPEGDGRLDVANGATPLNNLVFELLNVASPGANSHAFRNPREGWVYVRVTSRDGAGSTSVQLDGAPVALRLVRGQMETMRYLPEGPHTVRLDSGGEGIERVEVRAIGELVYATYGYNPHIAETGDYTWDFLRKHCLDHYNSIIGSGAVNDEGSSTQEAELREWTAEGKRWFTVAEVPYDVATADEAYARWANAQGMQHPLMSGIWADEFGVGEKYGKRTVDMYPLWIEALRKLRANPAFAGRGFYAYGPSRLLPAERFTEMYPFIQTLMESDCRLAPEWYLPEAQSRPGRAIVETGDLVAEFSPSWEQASRASFEAASPGAAANRVMVVSLFSEMGWESCDLFPGYNFNVFLDAELQFIATDPAFFGVRGIQGYLSGYCAEEQTRLFAELVRHYAIEGKTERFLTDPYVLHHLVNPDLVQGAEGWTSTPATTGAEQVSIEVKAVPGLGNLLGKYHAPEGTGDVAFWTRRSAERPNVLAQPIRNLTPGRCYSLRFVTGDFQELSGGTSARRKHGVSVTIEKGEPVSEESFQAVVQGAFWQRYGAFNPANPYWINYHQVVFRATGEEAELSLSDWDSDGAPGGPVGEELFWSFFQVQPYFE